MRIKETKVYPYAELSDDAKARARDWFREITAGDDFYAEHITDEMHEALKALGFDVCRSVRVPGCAPRQRSTLEWSGFWSQGDGAAFGGTWYASECAPGKFLADRPPVWPAESGGHECPSNKELHRIAWEILACKRAGLNHATLRVARGHFMALDDASMADETEADDGNAASNELRTRFIQAARDLASWFYEALESAYEYENSDEAVAESIEANEYEFDETGRRA